MTTIDKLDIQLYFNYAYRIEMVEKINQQYRLDLAASIPPQTYLLDINPKLSELDLLLGVVPVLTPWAYFFPPQTFKNQRKSPFTFSQVLPGLDDQTSDMEEEDRIEEVACSSIEEKNEKAAILGFIKQKRKLNEWLIHIVKQVGRFIAG